MLDQKNRVTINYFAMPPSTFGAICKGLGEAKLNAKPARVVMEKPLGTSLETSREINDQVGEFFEECQVYRIDHYLGKETVLNLLALRFANSCSSITGTAAPSITSKSPSRKRWVLKGAGVTSTRRADARHDPEPPAADPVHDCHVTAVRSQRRQHP